MSLASDHQKRSKPMMAPLGGAKWNWHEDTNCVGARRRRVHRRERRWPGRPPSKAITRKISEMTKAAGRECIRENAMPASVRRAIRPAEPAASDRPGSAAES